MADTREALGETLLVLVGGVLEETAPNMNTLEMRIRIDTEAEGGLSRTQGPWLSEERFACRPGTECSSLSHSARQSDGERLSRALQVRSSLCRRLTDLVCDLATLLPSFALRSRFCEALAPC